jgi:ABC-2 type transport system ATP-binding protein
MAPPPGNDMAAPVGGAADPPPPLCALHLGKRYGDRQAVADVSCTVGRGEVFGFLGPNGAGKSTTVRMLVGLLRPTSGRVLVAGRDLADDRDGALRRLGCIVESPDFYGYLTGRENLEHFARMSGGAALARVAEVGELVRLTQRLDDRVGTYSLGMRQRLGIAQALLGDPELLVLDEPANGLDPAGIHELRNLLRRLADQRGLAVFVSSHLLGEVEKMCDRVAIVHRGRVLAAGRTTELTGSSGAAGAARSLESVFLEVTGGGTVGD